ncbi:MAG: hypothetical protein EXQ67_08415 [Thermoleophilia bacterium]|nr:hypothetical protein [Thermoleophilia bacterium]
MAAVDHHFLLDTGTWVAVRRRRFIERFAVWGILATVALVAVGVLWGGAALVGSLTSAQGSPAEAAPEVVVPAPPVAKTPVIVWNGLGADGVAAEAARQLMMKEYPIAAVSNAPDHSYMKTYVMYQASDAAGAAAAGALIKNLHLKGAVAQPLDGVRKDQLGGARLLLIVADPLSH